MQRPGPCPAKFNKGSTAWMDFCHYPRCNCKFSADIYKTRTGAPTPAPLLPLPKEPTMQVVGKIDVKAIESEARAEFAEELSKAAKARIKAKLIQIAGAEKVVANLKAEYAAILLDAGE